MRAAVDVDAPAGGPRRPRRVRVGVHDPRRRTASRSSCRRPTAWDQDRDRGGARAVRHHRHRPRGHVRRRRRLLGRRAGRVPRLRRRRAARPGRCRRARRRRRRRLPAGRLRAGGRRDGRAPGPDGGRRVRPGRLLHRDRRADRGSSTRRRPRRRRRDRGPRLERAPRQRLLAGAGARRRPRPRPPRALPVAAAPPARGRRRRARPLTRGAGARARDAGRRAADAHTHLRPRTCSRSATALAADGSELHGIAHVTGGGLPGNVPRALPPGLGARLDPSRVADAVGDAAARELGGIEDDELRATFNGGLGMVLVVPPRRRRRATVELAGRARDRRPGWWAEVVDAAAPGGARYAEAAP